MHDKQFNAKAQRRKGKHFLGEYFACLGILVMCLCAFALNCLIVYPKKYKSQQSSLCDLSGLCGEKNHALLVQVP